jgi:phospholipase C
MSAAVGARLALPLPARAGVTRSRVASLRPPDSLPDPSLPAGTDTLAQIEHIVVVMMENHSFDNYLGMLGRGDGFTLGPDARPVDANRDGRGNLLRAFHMPSTCQQNAHPSQSWDASHLSLGRAIDTTNDGFVVASGPVAMGYWSEDDIPFYYGLARTFPLCDRYFGSVLAQTYPNRRFLLAGSAGGIISTTAGALTAPEPPNGSILDRLNAYGVPWRNYYSDLPGVGVLLETAQANRDKLAPIGDYFADAAAGTLPAVSYVDPLFDGGESEENADDIQRGESFVARVIRAAMEGPGWPRTLLVWTYDEHGGYYDHVRPPRAPEPDAVPPGIEGAPFTLPGGYDRYGFRVPAVIVSPWARPGYVSHVVHDHTSILKLIETKWNLPALTFRDANASDLLDSLDLDGPPQFLEPPLLPAPGVETMPSRCTPGDPGEIPPPGALIAERVLRRRLPSVARAPRGNP